MKAIILAAGRGSRMGNATETQPKCFTVLGGKKLIDWQKKSLHEAGINEIAAVTGYRSELIKSEVKHTFHNEIWAETNMVYSLYQADDWLSKDTCVISYSDIVYSKEIVQSLIDNPASFCITYDEWWYELWSLRLADPLSDAETFDVSASGRLIEIGQKPKSLSQIKGQYMGLIKTTPESWKEIKLFLEKLTSFKKLDMTGLMNLLLKNDFNIQTCKIFGKWCEVDTQEDWQKYEMKLINQGKWSHDWRN